jgi:hypothetical protein
MRAETRLSKIRNCAAIALAQGPLFPRSSVTRAHAIGHRTVLHRICRPRRSECRRSHWARAREIAGRTDWPTRRPASIHHATLTAEDTVPNANRALHIHGYGLLLTLEQRLYHCHSIDRRFTIRSSARSICAASHARLHTRDCSARDRQGCTSAASESNRIESNRPPVLTGEAPRPHPTINPAANLGMHTLGPLAVMRDGARCITEGSRVLVHGDPGRTPQRIVDSPTR